MFNSNLSIAERERICYIRGDIGLASAFGEAVENETVVDGFEAILTEETDKAFLNGKNEGLGIDSAERIEELEDELQKSNEEVAKLRKLLFEFNDKFFTEDSKTVAGRKRIQATIIREISRAGY